MTNITIVLPLKDRPDETKIWLEHNIFEGFCYLIADGSTSDENESVCRPYLSENVRYFRYPPDLAYEDFLKKIIDAISLVETDFMMMADSDDFLLEEGLSEMAETIERDPEISLIQGKVGMVMPAAGSTYKRISDWACDIRNEGSCFANLTSALADYYHLYYALIRVDLQKQVLGTLKDVKSNSFLFHEYFHTFLLLSVAERFATLPHYYYVRLLNKVSSSNQTQYPKSRFDAVLNEELYLSVKRAVSYMGKTLDLADSSELFELVRAFYIDRMIDNFDMRLRDKIMVAIRYKIHQSMMSFRSRFRGVASHQISTLFD